MNRPLFVHSNSKLLNRLSKESNAFGMVTPSTVQALQWIMDPTVKLSGVFFSPHDATFSAFRFLEIALSHRPALPIFLFEPQLSKHPESAQKIMKSTGVKGVFLGNESYSSLVENLKNHLDSIAITRAKAPDKAQHIGYIALPVSDFFSSGTYPYTIFVFNEQEKPVFFAESGSAIDAAYLGAVIEKTQYLYVREDEVQKTKAQMKSTREAFLDDADFPNAWKTAEMMAHARSVLNEMKESGINEQLVEYTQGMLRDLFKLISKIDHVEGSLHSMIDRAKQCHRSVFCASYAMLVCKQMRYEKTATLEILGISSVLQDISLYRTPYGDLSEKMFKDLGPEELKYYLQHPTFSADLVAQHTDVPQVTLQVVRQHHERKDKTGFPNRIGGTQLHPMAEILSLINAYYEISKSGQDDAAIILELQRAIIPHYSETVVTAFKHVLGNILKDKIHATHQEQELEAVQSGS